MRPFYLKNSELYLLDQRQLPGRIRWIVCRNEKDVFRAIRGMVVRGAPAIGIVAAYGMYLGLKRFKGHGFKYQRRVLDLRNLLIDARPTAVNLRNCLDTMTQKLLRDSTCCSIDRVKQALGFATEIHKTDEWICRKIGNHGARLIQKNSGVMTYCNAGGLATSGYGTALAVIFSAHQNKKNIRVFACETRPWLQGARLTALELMLRRVPVTLICDNAAGSVMSERKVDAVVVGADRIARNGDTANKIGTYGLAVLAREHGIPFYVAAPSTTFDLAAEDGREIPIEQRAAEEITHWRGKRIAARGVRVFNPSFDRTPAKFISGFITEFGIARSPYRKSIRAMLARRM